MKVILAEKPSVAREIAVLLGATEKKEGYFRGNTYCVTWALGNLISLAMPEDYGMDTFRKDNLPILPHPFKLTVRKIKKGKEYVPDPRVLHQLKVIDILFKECESIIVATDAGREGELIFRYIYSYLQCTKPFERLWISSLTEKAIKNGFENIKPGSEFQGLYLAAKSRSQADWLIGINTSQALSIAAGNGIYSLGRVQTPTLSLVCKRYLENKNFEKQKYRQIELVHSKNFIECKSLSQMRFNEKKQADDILKSIQRNGSTASILSIETKEVIEQPPLLFDLTGLQKEANTKLNFTAEETLTIAQALYEKKFITYPRTGSQYISEDIWPEIPNLVRLLQSTKKFRSASENIKWGHFNKKIVNNLRITDHHGLLITDRIPSSLSAKENAVYEMIAHRLLESVSDVCKKEIIDIHLQVLHYEFVSKGVTVKEPGWRSIQSIFSSENETLQPLPEFRVGDEVKIKSSRILEKSTQPPALYSEAGLLSAIENAGRKLTNEKEREVLSSIGIGTPATRASIIETLIIRNYIKRIKKTLVPTDKGIQVYEIIKDKKIADAVMTAEWELVLHRIETGDCDSSDFKSNIEEYTRTITQELLETNFEKPNFPLLLCPKCKALHLIITEKLITCPDEICGWIQYRNVCGVQISVENVESLLIKGKTSLIKNMKSKSGKKFDAYLVLQTNGTISFEFEK